MFYRTWDDILVILRSFWTLLGSILSTFGPFGDPKSSLRTAFGPWGSSGGSRVICRRSKGSLFGSFFDPKIDDFSTKKQVTKKSTSGSSFLILEVSRRYPTSQKCCVYCLELMFCIFQLFRSQTNCWSPKAQKTVPTGSPEGSKKSSKKRSDFGCQMIRG